jgi:hypothetical protein
MGKGKAKGPALDVRPLVEHLGWKYILQQTGLQGLVAQVGLRPIIEQVGLDDLAAQLKPQERQELLRLLQEPPSEERGRRRK